MTSTAIYTCYRQLHPPTGVDHAIFGSVTGPGSRNLVVGKACILELYRVNRQDEQSKNSNATGNLQSMLGDSDDTGFFLELAGSFPLAGNITALAVIPVRYEGYFSSTSRSPQHNVSGTKTTSADEALASQDILIVCFGTAQVALVAYDADLGRLTTLSIHNFDADAIGAGSGGVESGYGLASALKDRWPTISAFDPEGRCMAAVVAGYQLVVLPTLRYIPKSVFLSEENKDRVVGSYRSFRRRQQGLRGSLGSPAADPAKRSKTFGESSIDWGHHVKNGSSTTANGYASGAQGATVGNGSVEGKTSGANGVDDHEPVEEAEHTEAGGGSGAESGEGEKDAAGGLANGGSRVAAAHWAVSKPFTVDLEEGGVTGFVKAMVFLHGLHEPAVAILFEPLQTCPGRLGKLRSTCRLVVMSINLIQGRSPVIWRVDDLPHDSWNIVAVPSPVGGLQVISTNAVLYVHESEVKSILAVNGYAKATVDEELLKCPLSGSSTDWGWASFRHSYSAVEVVDLSSYDICVELDSCCCAFLNPTSLLITLRGGEVYALRLHLAGGGDDAIGAPNRVVGQSLRPLGRSSPCSVLVVSGSGTVTGTSCDSPGYGAAGDPPKEPKDGTSSGLVFMGSRVGDSLLVKFSVTSTSAEPGARGTLFAKREAKPEDLEDVMHGDENPGDGVREAEAVVKNEDVARSSEVPGAGGVGLDGEFVPRPGAGDAPDVGAQDEDFGDNPTNGDIGSACEVSILEADTVYDEAIDRVAKAGRSASAEKDTPSMEGAGQPGEGDEEEAGEDRSSRPEIADGSEGNASESGPMRRISEEGDCQRSRRTALDGEKTPETLEMSDEGEPATKRKRLRRGDNDDRSQDAGTGDGDDEDLGGAGEISPEDSGPGFEGTDGKKTRGVFKRAKISDVKGPRGMKQEEEHDEALPLEEETAQALPEATRTKSVKGENEAGGEEDDVPETSTVMLERLEKGKESGKTGRNENRGSKKRKMSDGSAGELDGEALSEGDGTKVTESGEMYAGADLSPSLPERIIPKDEAEDALGLHQDEDEDDGDFMSEMPRERIGEGELDWDDEGEKVPHDATSATEAAHLRVREGVKSGTAAVKEEPVESKISFDIGVDSESEMGAEVRVGRGSEGEGLAAREASESVETQTEVVTSKSSDAADAVGNTSDDVGKAKASSSLEERTGVESDLSDGAQDRAKQAVELSTKSEAESFAEISGLTGDPNGPQSLNVPEVIEVESMDVDPTPGVRDGNERGSKRTYQASEVPSSDKEVQEAGEDPGDTGEGAACVESMQSDPSDAGNKKGRVGDAEVTTAVITDLPDTNVSDSSTAVSGPSKAQVAGESEPVAASEVATDVLLVSGKTSGAEDKALEESTVVPVKTDTGTSPPPTSTVDRMLQQPHKVPTLDELEDAEEELLLYGRRLKAAADAGGGSADARRRSTGLPGLGPGSGERLIDAVGFRLKVVDSLSTLGPIVDAVIVPSVYHVPRGALRSGAGDAGKSGARSGGLNKRDSGSAGGLSGPTTSGAGIRTSLVCAAGFGRHGSFAVFSAGLRTEVVVDLLVPGATGVFAVGEQHGHQDTLVLVSLSPILQAAAQGGGVEGPGQTRVLSFEADSKVIELEDGGDENPFVGEASTIDVCAMVGGTIVQAHSQGLRVTRGRQAMQDILTSEDIELGGLGAAAGVTVLGVAAAGVYACCLLSGSRLQLMALEEGEEDEADLIPAAAESLDENVDGDGGDGDGDGSVDRPPGINGSQGGAGVTAEAGVGDGGVSSWEDVEAMCMFGVKEGSGDDAAPDLEGSNVLDARFRAGGKRGLFVHNAEKEPFQDMGRAEMREVAAAAAVAVSTAAVADLPGGTSYDSDEEEWTALYSRSGRGAILGQATKSTRSSAMTSLGSTRKSISRCVEGDQMETGSQGTSEKGRAGADGARDGDGNDGGDGGGDGDGDGDNAPGKAMASDGNKGWWGGSSWSVTLPEVTAYLFVCRRGGNLEIYACRGRGREARGFLVFRTSRASLAPVTLWNELLPPNASHDRVGIPPGSAELETTSAGCPFGSQGRGRGPGSSGPSDGERQQERNAVSTATEETRDGQGRLPGDFFGGTIVQNGRSRRLQAGDTEGTSSERADARGDGRVAGSGWGNAKESSGTENTGTLANTNGQESATPSNPANSGTAGDGAAAGGAGGGGGVAASTTGAGPRKSSAGGAECSNDGRHNSDIPCPVVTDVIVHPVGAVDGPAILRRLVLVMHLENGDLLVYEARMSSGEGVWMGGGSSCREQVVCFSKLSHDFITRKVKGVPREAALPDPSRGRALRAVRWAAGQEGVSFARPGCRSALILAERGAVCISQIAQDDLGDGAGSPPLPPGAPPSWAGIGLGSLAPLFNRRAFPGGGFAGITAGGGRLRFISAAPAASQLVTPGVSGGGGLGGGGQGHFVATKVAVGATIHSLVHLPKELVQPGKAGDILRDLLLRKGYYVALVSRMVDAIVEETSAQGGGEDEDDVDGMAGEDEEVEGPVRHIVKHKNWTVADPALGGAPPLLVPKFELRILALAAGAGLSSSATSAGGKTAGDDEDVKPSSSASGAGADGGSGVRARGAGEAVDRKGKGEGPTSTAGGGDGRAGGEEGAHGHKTHGPDAGFGGLAGGAVSGDMLSAATVETHPLALDENGLCICLVTLEQRGSLRMYVAIGTGMNDSQGEDKAARGRLLLFEVDYAYLAREDGSHEYAVKLRQVYAKEQLGPVAGESGPVSAIAQLGRHIILSVGKKIIVNRWEPKSCTLELIGFHDPRVYVVSLSVIKKRFVLLGDVIGSVQLVVWREEDHSLTPLSKDHEECDVYSTEYLVDEPAMGIVVADSRRNLKVLQYAPNAPDSRGGTRLLCQSDFFLGSRVAKLTRRRTRGNLRGGARYCLLAGTLDGGLGVVLPVDERVFRRLYALQGIMSNALGHTGAANPRAFRLFHQGPAFRNQSKKNMLDGTLLWRFVGLDSRTQHDLTRAIGTTVDRVMANLLDIDLASLF